MHDLRIGKVGRNAACRLDRCYFSSILSKRLLVVFVYPWNFAISFIYSLYYMSIYCLRPVSGLLE